MTLEQQVVSLKLAKKLKELRVKPESLYYWHIPKKGADPKLTTRPNYGHGVWCAFTVAELGEMLPSGYVSGITNLPDDEHACCHWYRVDAFGLPDDETCEVKAPSRKPVYGVTEADARAKMLIYLVENNLIQLQ